MFSEQLSLLWKIIKRGFFILAGLLIFIIIIEIIRALQTLAAIHTLLAWFVGLIGFGSLALGVWKVYRLLKRFPSAPTPPDPSTLGSSDHPHYLGEQLHYMRRIVKNLSNNQNLSEQKRDKLIQELSKAGTFSTSGSVQELDGRITSLDKDVIKPAFKELDEQAEMIVKNTVRDTIVGVMLLPFRAADIYLVLYRNGAMFFELVNLYRQRPVIVETYRIFKDVLKMVLAVNVLGYTQKLTQSIMSGLPVFEKAADDIIQGIGAGIMTTAVGKATIQRCRAYKQWDVQEQINSYGKTTRQFVGYVIDMFTDDVLPTLSWPWKQAWNALKKIVTKSEFEMEDTIDQEPNSKASWWRFWEKRVEIETEIG